MADRAVVTGFGWRTPLGSTPDAVWTQLLSAQTAARSWTDLEEAGFPISVACRIDELDAPNGRRGSVLMQAAMGDAAAMAGVDEPDAVYVGSTMGESAAYERAADRSEAIEPDAWNPNGVGTEAVTALGWSAELRGLGTACAAGNYAIGLAARAVERGRHQVVVAGGVEPFSRIAMVGFARMRAMTGDRCRPFDAERKGMQLGEGAAFLVIETASRARARGAEPLATVGALGLSSDAHHPTTPRPDGSGMEMAMRVALDRQGLAPSDVGWVCAHGTGTRRSDAAEAAALSRIFGPGSVPVSGTKGSFGHAMGAASAIEAVVAVQSLRAAVVPPTTGLTTIDEAIDADVVSTPRSFESDWVLSAAYAFGGLNSALLIGAA